MLKRFYITFSLAFIAICAIGLLSPDLGTVLISLLVWGPCFIAALIFYVLRAGSDGTMASTASRRSSRAQSARN